MVMLSTVDGPPWTKRGSRSWSKGTGDRLWGTIGSVTSLPDMYTLKPKGCAATLGLQSVHIRQTSRAHVTNTYCTKKSFIQNEECSAVGMIYIIIL